MHQLKTAAQVILILSIVNFVLAAPAVRGIHEARDDVMVRVLAEKRVINGISGTPMVPWEDSDWDSRNNGYETASDDEGYETASDEPPPHPSTPTEQKMPKIMTPGKIKAAKIAMGASLVAAAILGLVVIQTSFKNSTHS
jgi:hypothetical protein